MSGISLGLDSGALANEVEDMTQQLEFETIEA